MATLQIDTEAVPETFSWSTSGHSNELKLLLLHVVLDRVKVCIKLRVSFQEICKLQRL